jgi:hypothetical protein
MLAIGVRLGIRSVSTAPLHVNALWPSPAKSDALGLWFYLEQPESESIAYIGTQHCKVNNHESSEVNRVSHMQSEETRGELSRFSLVSRCSLTISHLTWCISELLTKFGIFSVMENARHALSAQEQRSNAEGTSMISSLYHPRYP